MPGPLAGVRVIEVAIAVLGPLATQVLGDMGAEIIKVETPDGDPMRQIGPARNPGMAAYFLTLNRNKKSLVLDLKPPAARQAMLRLPAGHASCRPGRLRRCDPRRKWARRAQRWRSRGA